MNAVVKTEKKDKFLHNFSRKIIIITNPFCFSVRSQRDTLEK